MKTKIFGIGYSRTGTTSLSTALNILGYNVTHHCSIQDGNYIWKDICKNIKTYDGIVSSALSFFYKRLDYNYPNSKFILTTRNFPDWKKSLKRFCPNEVFNIRDYENNIRSYFIERDKDLLIMNICSNFHSWPTLCSFLGCEQPNTPFPWENKHEMEK